MTILKIPTEAARLIFDLYVAFFSYAPFPIAIAAGALLIAGGATAIYLILSATPELQHALTHPLSTPGGGGPQ